MEKPSEATTARREDKPRDSHPHGEKKRSREDEKKISEMERRKIQKYKDDKLKERKDHTRRVLEQQAQEKRRALLGRQSEFIGTLEFRNQLPDLPFDAKFIQYPHDPERFVKYKPSLVERDYVHEFYVEPNLGLPIDLIDPEKFEVPDVSERAMTNVDIELLNMPEVISGSSAAKAKIRPHVPWLRRSEFMGTDLSEAVHQFKNESELQVEIRDKNQAMLSVIMQKDLEQRANESFDLCPPADKIEHPLKADLKPVQVWDVFPDEILSSNIYSILSYDILPSSETKHDPAIYDRESHALLRNVVTVSQPNASDVLLGSILFPSSGNKAFDDAKGDDSDEDGGSEKFKFFRDYVLNINHFPTDVQQLMLMVNPDSTTATYASLSTNITLKKTKIGGDAKRRRGAVVYRRPYNEAEEEKRTESLLTVGGIYDERLNGMVGHSGSQAKDAGDDVGSPDVSDEDSD